MIHGSTGHREPASEDLLSELAIVAGIVKATPEPNPTVDWDSWTADEDRVCDLIEASYPDDLRDYDARLFEPGGLRCGNPAHD